MSQSTKPTVVIAFIKPGQIQQQVESALESNSEFELVSETNGVDDAARFRVMA